MPSFPGLVSTSSTSAMMAATSSKLPRQSSARAGKRHLLLLVFLSVAISFFMQLEEFIGLSSKTLSSASRALLQPLPNATTTNGTTTTTTAGNADLHQEELIKNLHQRGKYLSPSIKKVLRDLPALSKRRPRVRVLRKDKIMQRGWDASPVVLEKHKLLFFTVPKVGCTVWKSLFRRMQGFADWNSSSPHDPATNGLRYLRDYPLETVRQMINDPKWTRAIFVRDPKERFLSAWLEKAYGDPWHKYVPHYCPKRSNLTAEICVERSQTLEGFLNLTSSVFPDPHWDPQHERMDPHHWETINFVGHMETMQADARRLLERVGAWKDYGATGWGKAGNASVFSSMDQVLHKMGAETLLSKYYTTQRLQDMVDSRYAGDYNLSILELEPTRISLL